ncbi:Hsp90-like protein, partial [Globisporangium splendens]
MFSGDGLPFGRHSDVLNATASDDESLVRLVEELKRRGNTAFQQKAFEEAEALYSKAIEVNGSNPLKNQHIFFANRSASRNSMGKTQLALDDAIACVALEPTYAKGHFRQAQALSKLKRYKEALAALTEALTLEPGNKSVHTLFGQVHELAMKEEEAPAVPSSPKKVTRVEVVKETASSAATKTTTSTSSVEKVDVDDEDIGGTVRGYKKLANGRVTTFFNNELTEEARQLIGDIAPKKVEDATAVQIKSVEGGSAWNVGNTFEEKDMTVWAKSKFETLFTGVSAPLPASTGVSGVVNAGAISDVTGDASIAVVRGAKRYIFDFAFTLKCTLHLDGDETTEGELKFLDVSSDSDGDYDVEAVVPSRYQTAGGKALHAALSAPLSPFRAALKAQLDQFVKEYHTF